MTHTKKQELREISCPPLNLPVGQVYVLREAIKILAVAGVSLDDVLAIHAQGYGGDFDYEESFENYEVAANGGDNHSLHDIAQGVTLHVHTPWHRQATIVCLYAEAE